MPAGGARRVYLYIIVAMSKSIARKDSSPEYIYYLQKETLEPKKQQNKNNEDMIRIIRV